MKGSIFCYWECQKFEWISTGKFFSYMSFLGWQKWEWHRYLSLCVFSIVKRKTSLTFCQTEVSPIWGVFWPLCYEALMACSQSLCLRKAVGSFWAQTVIMHLIAKISGMSYCLLDSLILPLIHISKSTCYIWVIPKTDLSEENTFLPIWLCSETS